MAQLTSLFNQFPESIKNLIQLTITSISPDQLILFGSRARDTHRKNSDFDIAVKGTIDPKEWACLKTRLDDEAISLHLVDLVLFESLGDDYKNNVATEGKLICG